MEGTFLGASLNRTAFGLSHAAFEACSPLIGTKLQLYNQVNIDIQIC